MLCTGVVLREAPAADACLGAVFVMATLGVGTVITLLSGFARHRVVRSPGHLATVTGAGGALMVLLAVSLLVLALLPSAR